MPNIFVVEDQVHAESLGEFPTLAEAWDELHRLSLIPWSDLPNVAPCQSWSTCGREYEIVEYETTTLPWTRIRCFAGLEVSAQGVVWGPEAPQRF